jgi:SAM-dependent methyltransferase
LSGDWFRSAFGERYLELYAHRDGREAAAVMALLFGPQELQGRGVLDVGCGAGRYLTELQARGAVPVGLDLSWRLLREARAASVAAPLVRADMREIPFGSGTFDWTLCMFTSFGYFASQREHAALAGELARVARCGVVVDAPNGPPLARGLVPLSRRETDAGIVEERRWLESAPPRVCKTIRLLRRGDLAELERYDERVMLFTREQFAAMFAPHGLAVADARGGYDGAPLDPQRSERILLKLTREPRSAGASVSRGLP